MAGAIYQAVLGRVSTLSEWTAANAILRPPIPAWNPSPPQEQIIDSLLASPGYAANIGTSTPSNAQFLTFLYQTALGRNPDPDGFNLWYNLLSTGTLTRSEEVLLFINSAEFQARTNLLYITSLYYTILLRTPDVGGLNFWTGVANGVPPSVDCPGILFSTIPACVEMRYRILGGFEGSCGFLGSLEWLALLSFPACGCSKRPYDLCALFDLRVI